MPSADPKPAPTDESAAARLCQQQRSALQDEPAITEEQMFGTTALCAGGKVFLFPWKDALVAKLAAPQAERLVASGNTALPGPGHGRTSKTWVAVPAQPRGRWERLAQDVRAFAAG